MVKMRMLVDGEWIHEGDRAWEGVSEHDAFLSVLIKFLDKAEPVDDETWAEPVEERGDRGND